MKNYLNIFFLNFLILLITSCQSPKYLKVNKLSKDNNKILPEVQYSLKDKFNPNDLDCIAVGQISDNTKKKEFKSLNKINLVRKTIYGHLSPKNYQDIELHRVANISKFSKDNLTLLNKLDCDAIIEAEITIFQNDFFITYSSTNVGLKLFLKNKNNEVLWKASHTAKSRAGNIPFSPIGLAAGIFSAGSNSEEEIALQMLDTVVRRLLKTLPERTSVKNRNQIKYTKAPKIENSTIKLNQVSKRSYNLFKSGEYEKAIELIDNSLRTKPKNHELIFLKGRIQLILNHYKAASENFLDAIAIKMDFNYLNGLGYSYAKLLQENKALAAYSKSIVINNKNSFAYYNSALILEKKGKINRASNFFYAAGTSALLNKDFTRASESYEALKRLSEINTDIISQRDKLGDLISELSYEKDQKFKIKKIKTIM